MKDQGKELLIELFGLELYPLYAHLVDQADALIGATVLGAIEGFVETVKSAPIVLMGEEEFVAGANQALQTTNTVIDFYLDKTRQALGV